MKEEFERRARARLAEVRQTKMPSPEELIARGITTRDTLEHLRRRLPPVPKPEPSPDDPSGWRTSIANADAAHQKLVADLKAKFEGRFDRANKAFETAQQKTPRQRGQSARPAQDRDEGMER